MVARSRRCPASSIIRSRLAGPSRRTGCARPPRAGPAPPRRRAAARRSAASRSRSSRSPAAVGFQGADPGSSLFPEATGLLRGVAAGLLELHPQPVGLPFRPGADLIAFTGGIGESLGDGLPGVGAHPVKFAAHPGLGGTRPFRLAAGRLRLGGSVRDGLVPLADGRGDLLIGCLPGRLQLGHVPGAKARRRRAVGHHPGTEPAQRARGIEHQPQQPQRHRRRPGPAGSARHRPASRPLLCARASTQARTTPISVSEASA